MHRIRSAAYLFAYDFESGTLQQLLIGRKLSQAVINQEYSISGDGQVVALTIEATDQIAGQLGLSNERDVFVFNMEEKTFNLVNLTKDEQPGNGPSDQPAISADGRFVTFSSEASNLVENDTNESRDIFVRDLETDVTELVSVDSNGEQSNQGVGEPTETMNGIASQKIGISEDGRFIVFTAQRSDLSPGSVDLCENSEGTECLVLYIHDRLTGETEHIDPQENRRLQMNLLPDISSNGRWITFMELVECPGFDVCFDVGFFDRELNTLRNLSRRFITQNRALSGESGPPRISQSTVWNSTRKVRNSTQEVITRFQRINKLAFSEDGRMIATGAQDGSVQVWDTTDLSQIYYEQSHLKSVTDVAFSPDSRLLATASMDGFLKIWDIDEERMIFNLLGEAYQVYSLSFSPDGRWLAGGTSQGLVVWEFTNGNLVQRYLLRQPRRVRGLAFSPDSAQLAFAADDNSVWVLNMQPFEVIHRLGGQDLDPLAVAFSPNGNYLAVGTMDGSLNLWEIYPPKEDERDPRLINTFWHPEWVNDLAFSPDGMILATLSNDFNIRLWSVPGGELIAQDSFESSERALSLAFSPDGMILATSTNQGGIVLWQDLLAVDEPRFFSRLDSDQLTIPPDYYPNYYPLPVELIKQAGTPAIVNRWSAAYNQSIYEAVDTLGLNLKAPAYLPAGMRFKGAKTEADDHFGLSIFYYDYAPAGDSLGAMFLVQASSTDIFPTVGVGTSAQSNASALIFNWANTSEVIGRQFG